MVKNTPVMDAEHIQRSLTRLAFEILEHNPDPGKLTIIGIQRRGEPLSQRLQKLLEKQTGVDIPLGTVDITFHRDDFRTRLVVPQVKATHIPFSIDAQTVILVDDVLYTGRTIRAALDELVSFGRPAKVQLAVLVDRGHREMPIKADYVAKNVPTHEGEHIAVRLNEIDGEEGVYLRAYQETK